VSNSGMYLVTRVAVRASIRGARDSSYQAPLTRAHNMTGRWAVHE
jgi:hypothetical protein